MKLKIAVLASGRGSNFSALLKNSRKEDSFFQIALLISDKENAGALETAKEEGIPHFFVNPKDFENKEAFENKMVEIVNRYDCGLVCLAGYMRILSPSFLKAWKKDVINIHPSLLPAFPGLDAQKQALEYGVKFSGCTVHFVDEGMDTGLIIGQKVVPVLETDDEETLSKRILKEEHILYTEVVNKYAQGKIKNKR